MTVDNSLKVCHLLKYQMASAVSKSSALWAYFINFYIIVDAGYLLTKLYLYNWGLLSEIM